MSDESERANPDEVEARKLSAAARREPKPVHWDPFGIVWPLTDDHDKLADEIAVEPEPDPAAHDLDVRADCAE